MYKLEKLNDKRANMLRELSTMEGGSGMDTGGGLVQGEDWKVKFESVKQKMSTYKMLKRELDEIQNEVFVLSRTEAVREWGTCFNFRGSVIQVHEKVSGIRWHQQSASWMDVIRGTRAYRGWIRS